MRSILTENFEELNEESFEAYDIKNNTSPVITDDDTYNIDLNRQIEQVLETTALIGGEVCKLRTEVDGLLDQNYFLIDSFKKLKDVILEKGVIDLDDFELACDVFEETSSKNNNLNFFKKVCH